MENFQGTCRKLQWSPIILNENSVANSLCNAENVRLELDRSFAVGRTE